MFPSVKTFGTELLPAGLKALLTHKSHPAGDACRIRQGSLVHVDAGIDIAQVIAT